MIIRGRSRKHKHHHRLRYRGRHPLFWRQLSYSNRLSPVSGPSLTNALIFISDFDSIDAGRRNANSVYRVRHRRSQL